MSIGKNIAQHRKKNHWTQKQLAELMNVSDKTISSWENERIYPDISSLILLSDYLNLSLDELIKEDMNMVKMIDENLEEGRKWKKWRWLIIVTSILVSGFILLNISWVIWSNHRQTELDNYSWSQEDLPEEFINLPGLYVKKEDLYVFLTSYETKHSISYLQFDNSIREVTIRNEKGFSLWIKNKNKIIFYDGNGGSIELNSDLSPLKGTTKSSAMTKEEQQIFIEKYKKEITQYYEVGLTVFNALN
ncbi:MAG: helix-turn-helix domain-containing protein [Enterococcus gilvus]